MLWHSSRGRPLNAPAAFIHPCQPIVAKYRNPAALIVGHYFAAVFFAQFFQQPMLRRKTTVSSNFGQRPNGGVLRSPAKLMLYDFAPQRDGANNGRVPAVPGCLALGLLFISKCVIPEVVSGWAMSEVFGPVPFGARSLEYAGMPGVRNEHAIQ